jgi:hypothetical protein
MTLILALGNSDQVLQVSDRRLSWDGQLTDDESSKAGLLACQNARLAFGFTGLAKWRLFRTREWLLEALLKAGPPDYAALGVLERLRARASETFRDDPALRNCPPKDRRLSVMFSGYLYQHDPPLIGWAILTNYQDIQGGHDDAEAWDEFTLTTWYERRPLDFDITLVQRVGNWRAMTTEDEVALRVLLRARKPASAITGKAVELVRQMADRPAAGGTIGKQLSVIRIPRDQRRPPRHEYHSSVNRHVAYGCDQVLLEPSNSWAVQDLQIRKVGGSETLPLSVRKVGRNRPCPCGSGRKYKYCHMPGALRTMR